MLNMNKDIDEPPSINTPPEISGGVPITMEQQKQNNDGGFFNAIKLLFKPKQDTSLRETIAEYIEEERNGSHEESISSHEKILISNVLNLRDMTAHDVMVPRADIIGINISTTHEELFLILAERQYSRLPVYKDTLDNIIGSIHVKDILATLAKGEKIDIQQLVRNVPIISPSMQALDLLLQMRLTRKHMVFVVDEYGGIDGLITIGDVIEGIVGEIDDEHDPHMQAELITHTDGTVVADARVDLEEFEAQFGNILDDGEREANDTLGGLVFSLAGRVPARGEVLTHNTGIVFEILDADPRRVKRLCIRNIPNLVAAE